MESIQGKAITSLNEPTQETNQYLHLLSTEILEHIVRLMSTRPWRIKWVSCICPSDVLTLHAVGGPLGTVAKNQVNIMDTIYIARNDEKSHTSGIRDILHLSRDAAIKLHNSLSTYTTERVFCQSVVSQKWTGLKTLSVNTRSNGSILADILPLFKGHLEQLYTCGNLCTPQDMNAIAENCTGLLELDLSISNDACDEMGRLWQTVGPTLRNLVVEMSDNNYHSNLHLISKYCPHLRELSLPQIQGSCSDLGAFCGQDGAQLKLLSLEYDVSKRDIFQRILSACPSVRLDVKIRSSFASIPDDDDCPFAEALRIFGAHLHVLTLDCNVVSHHSIAPAASRCLNISSLTIYSNSAELPPLIGAFFSDRKPELTHLSINARDEDEVSDEALIEVMNILENRTGDIVSFKSIYRILPLHSFRQFALANRGLQNVELAAGSAKRKNGINTGEFVASIIQDFAVCPQLNTLTLTDDELFVKNGHRLIRGQPLIEYEEAKQACLSLRLRRVHVDIHGENHC